MPNITLYNDSSARMTVMALGQAIDWNPKTTLVVSEVEAEKLLKIGDYIKKYDDISANSSKIVADLSEENKALKTEIEELKAEIESLKNPNLSGLDRDSLKAKAKELGIDFAKNIKNEELAKLISEKEGK